MAAVGGVVGLGLFCLCEIVPYANRWMRRQSRRRMTSLAGRVQKSMSDFRQHVCKHATNSFRGLVGKQLEDILANDDVAREFASYLLTSEACILRSSSSGLREGAWGNRIHPCFYVFGGQCEAPSSIERFDPVNGTQSWEMVPPMSQGRFWGAGAAMAGRFFFCGGTHGQGALNSVDCFDVETAHWEALPGMLNRRVWPVACAISGVLYVCSGKEGQKSLKSAEYFDLQFGEWEATEPLTEGRHGAAAVSGVSGDGFYVCGGLQNWEALNSVERFDASLERWIDMPEMRCKRGWPTGVMTQDYLYVCGGRLAETALSSVECFDFESESWKQCPPMSLGRHGALSAVIGGYLYIFGGRAGSGDGGMLDSNEKYDIEHGHWTPVKSMLQARAWSAGAVLASRTASSK